MKATVFENSSAMSLQSLKYSSWTLEERTFYSAFRGSTRLFRSVFSCIFFECVVSLANINIGSITSRCFGKWARAHPRKDGWTRERDIVDFHQSEACLPRSSRQASDWCSCSWISLLCTTKQASGRTWSRRFYGCLTARIQTCFSH